MGGTEWGTFATRRHVETLRNCREGGTFATRRHVGNCRVVFFLFFSYFSSVRQWCTDVL